MALYRAEVLQIEVPYGEAINRLAALEDADLIARLPAYMLRFHHTLTQRSWQPDEPENESLASELRAQARADISAAYFGETDYCADERLAYASTRPYPTLIFLSEFDPDDDEADHCESSNPVIRLTALGICKGPPAEPLDLPIIDRLTEPLYPPGVRHVVLDMDTTITARPPLRRAVTAPLRQATTISGNYDYPVHGYTTGTTGIWESSRPNAEEAAAWLAANSDRLMREPAPDDDERGEF